MEIEVQKGWLGREVSRRYKLRKKTKNVTTVVGEIYLRDDICCGSAACRSCVQESPPLPAASSHYLIPDAEALLRFLEIWELPQISCVIYLASVIKEALLQCNQRTYRRLRALFTDRRRQSLYFDDEHYIFTWSLFKDKDSGTNVKPSGNRVEIVAAWFYEHWEGLVPIVTLRSRYDVTSSDVEDKALIDQLKHLYLSDPSINNNKRLKVLDVDTYIKTFWYHDASVSELYNSLVQSLVNFSGEDSNREFRHPNSYEKNVMKGTLIYKEHLPGKRLEADVTSGALRAGVFFVNKHRPLEGYVQYSMKGETSRQKISVVGRKDQNRALPGDVVAVSLFGPGAKEKLLQMGTSVESVNPLDSNGDLAVADQELIQISDISDDVEPAKNYGTEDMRSGEVVGILQRSQRDYVACLVKEDEDSLNQPSSNRKEHFLCIPMDRRVPMVGVVTRLADRLVGQRFVIRIDAWEQNSKTPRGHFVRLLGPIGDLHTEDMSLLVENGINTSPFSSASMAELPEDTENHRWSIPSAELASRRDLRLLHRACSIDPPGSRDVDDALSVRRVSDNLMEIGVHIADVSYFVQQNSLLDLEARARGTTVYMVGKSWQMLPSLLSENLCSLVAGKDRLAVSVIWTVDLNRGFEIVDVWFGRTIIRSRHQMFYAQAQAILDGQTLPPGWEITGGRQEETDLASDLLILATFAQIRKDGRKADGALELSSSELRFETAANKEPISMDTKLELPMNWIVAEMMVLANSYVAEKTYRALPSKALLRMHGPPRLDNFSLLLECCAARGFAVDTSSNKALAKSLDRMRDSNDPTVENAFRALATRAMSEAEYCSTAEATDSSGFYHYGLALPFYTHFTSPIRRYADVLVHRMLIAASEDNHGLEKPSSEETLRKFPDGVLSGIELIEIAEHLNERHRASKLAQKECNELYMLMYLQNHAQTQQAVIISIHEKGMVVFVPKYDIRAPVYLQDKKDHVIIPAVSDDVVSESKESLSTMESLVVFKQEGRIGITNGSTGKVLHEYRLMDTVWIQLRADGSRAHAPKLNVRLLSPNHPAAIESTSSRKLGGFRNRFGLPKNEEILRYDLAARAPTSVSRSKMINDMAQILAAGQPLMSISSQPIGKRSLKRKDSTIHDVVDEFKRLKASSIYLDLIDHCTKLNKNTGADTQHHRERSITEPQKHAENVSKNYRMFVPLTVGMRLTNAILPPEQRLLEHLRRLWEKKLGHAARIRAVRLWSNLPEECGRQVQRKDNEAHLRGEAKFLSACLV